MKLSLVPMMSPGSYQYYKYNMFIVCKDSRVIILLSQFLT